MFGWIQRIFNSDYEEEIVGSFSENKYKDCDVEYMPITGRYYPRYKGKYLFPESDTGGYSLSPSTLYTVYKDSEEKAWDVIDRFLELRGKDTVILTKKITH